MAHLNSWCERFGASYGITSNHAGGALLVVGLLLCIWAMRVPRLRFFAIAGPASMILWFFTGSYDFRNAAAPLTISLVAIVGALWLDIPAWQKRPLRMAMPRSVLILATLCCAWHLATASVVASPVGKTTVFMQNRKNRPSPTSIFVRPFKPFTIPLIATLEPGKRHMGVCPWGNIRDILFNAPFGQRATHLLADGGLYRVLAPKGIYMRHKNRYNNQQRFDVALGEPYIKPPASYEKVARFKNLAPLDIPVRLFQPEFKPVAMQLSDADNPDVRTIQFAPGTNYLIRFADSFERSPYLKEGILSLRTSPAKAPATVYLSRQDAARDPYAMYFESVRQDDSIRLIYWMNDPKTNLPQFVLQTAATNLRIVAAEWGQ